jgi:TetR/AcrR family transcriptional regulator, ethionamide resistance regulator
MTEPSTPPGRGRRVKHPSGEDRERAILATAEALLSERPLKDISVDDLARGAGISRPTFYFYFPSKEAVVLTLLDRVAGEARTGRDSVLARLGEGVGAPEVWRDALGTIYETFRAHRPVVLAAADLFNESEEVRKLWGRVIEGFVGETAAVIELERDRGVAPPGPDARALATALNWMNERVFYAGFAGQDPALPDDAMLDTLLSVWSRSIYRDDNFGA